jgi:hypothetical protein
MRVRIQLITLMRIRILPFNLMQIHANPEMNPQHWLTHKIIKLTNVAYGSVFALDPDPLTKIKPHLIGLERLILSEKRTRREWRVKHLQLILDVLQPLVVAGKLVDLLLVLQRDVNVLKM